MSTSKEYMQFILDQLSNVPDVRMRSMMGEYILYYRDKQVGGLYDDRFLVKPVAGAAACLPNAPREVPYPGAREMLLVENVDDRAFLAELLEAMWDDLPALKAKKPKNRA